MRTKQLTLLSLIQIVVLCLFASATFADDTFPLREKFPDSATISTEDLHQKYEKALIFDVRSSFEYDVIHVQNAINAPVADVRFVKKVQQTISEHPEKELVVFYCNGHTCAKSYKAEVKAREAGISGFAYDSGIFEWTSAHPELAVLVGKTPVDTSKLISKDTLKTKMLPADVFAKDSQGPNAFLIDVREPIQRKKTPDFATHAAKLTMDNLVKNLKLPVFKKQIEGKTLYIFDAVGKQVRWLQYHLEDQGIKDYYFLDKGVWSIFGDEGAI